MQLGEGAEPPGAAGVRGPLRPRGRCSFGPQTSFLTGLLPAVSRFEKLKISLSVDLLENVIIRKTCDKS